jgi:hypothetical protein
MAVFRPREPKKILLLSALRSPLKGTISIKIAELEANRRL